MFDVDIFDAQNLGRNLAEPTAFGVDSTLNLYEIDKLQMFRFAVGIYRIRNHVVGIQCFADGMRFFTKIEHPGYCKKDVHLEVKQTREQWEDYKENWERPESWVAYHHQTLSCIRVIRFADQGYPHVPDLSMFASALAKKLGFAYAQHSRRVKYDTVSWSGSTRTTTHNIAILHEDCFVYSPKAYHTCLQEWKRTGLLQKEKPAPENPENKPKTWE